MKVTIFFLCLAMAIVLGHGYDIEEELEDYILEDMLDNNDPNYVRSKNWFKRTFNKAKNLGKRIGNSIKKGVESGCDIINQVPGKELNYRVAAAFPELISEDGFYETADVRKIASDVRKACGLLQG